MDFFILISSFEVAVVIYSDINVSIMGVSDVSMSVSNFVIIVVKEPRTSWCGYIAKLIMPDSV